MTGSMWRFASTSKCALYTPLFACQQLQNESRTGIAFMQIELCQNVKFCDPMFVHFFPFFLLFDCFLLESFSPVAKHIKNGSNLFRYCCVYIWVLLFIVIIKISMSGKWIWQSESEFEHMFSNHFYSVESFVCVSLFIEQYASVKEEVEMAGKWSDGFTWSHLIQNTVHTIIYHKCYALIYWSIEYRIRETSFFWLQTREYVGNRCLRMV